MRVSAYNMPPDYRFRQESSDQQTDKWADRHLQVHYLLPSYDAAQLIRKTGRTEKKDGAKTVSLGYHFTGPIGSIIYMLIYADL